MSGAGLSRRDGGATGVQCSEVSVTYYTTTQLELTVVDCCNCGMRFAMTTNLNQRLRNKPGSTFYCPAGHSQHYTGKSAEQKLADAEAREVALRDQLHAAEADAEATRVRLLRDRHRFANGVCPCCNRSFENVRRHMTTKHPDYDASEITLPDVRLRYKCSCGRTFETPRGLAVHQGHSRSSNWTDPSEGKYWRHLTVTM
jgi:hypothetical protein